MSLRASEQGAVAPASLLVAAIVAVAIGVVGYALTSSPTHHRDMAAVVPATSMTPTSSPQPAAPATSAAKPSPTAAASPTATASPIDRTAYDVAIFNDSMVNRLAARTSVKAQNVGWKVVQTAEWTGSTVSTPTIYYPASMQAAAQELGSDLGISNLQPAISPMPMDRLTVVLTANYQP